jgi:hypothetical protein
VHLQDTVLEAGIDTSAIAASLPDGLSGADISGFVTEVKQQAIDRQLDDGNVENFLITETDFSHVIATPRWSGKMKHENGVRDPFVVSM